MDIQFANTIPLCKIFAVWGISPMPTNNWLDLYKSPFNDGQRSRLVVNNTTNTWFDPVTEQMGDVIKLVCLYLQSQDVNHTVMDALRWLKNMIGYNPSVIQLPPGTPDYKTIDHPLTIKDVSPLSEPVLIRYLELRRGIPFHTARHTLKQLRIRNGLTDKSFIAIGFENEDGGFAIRNPTIKAHVGPRAISFIRGKTPKPPGIHIFKDVYDYLSEILLRNGRLFNDDCIILNSVDCLQDMTGYVRNYGYQYLCSWLGNDEQWKACTDLLKQFSIAEGMKHYPKNEDYHSFKDLNEKLSLFK